MKEGNIKLNIQGSGYLWWSRKCVVSGSSLPNGDKVSFSKLGKKIGSYCSIVLYALHIVFNFLFGQLVMIIKTIWLIKIKQMNAHTKRMEKKTVDPFLCCIHSVRKHIK